MFWPLDMHIDLNLDQKQLQNPKLQDRILEIQLIKRNSERKQMLKNKSCKISSESSLEPNE